MLYLEETLKNTHVYKQLEKNASDVLFHFYIQNSFVRNIASKVRFSVIFLFSIQIKHNFENILMPYLCVFPVETEYWSIKREGITESVNQWDISQREAVLLYVREEGVGFLKICDGFIGIFYVHLLLPSEVTNEDLLFSKR